MEGHEALGAESTVFRPIIIGHDAGLVRSAGKSFDVARMWSHVKQILISQRERRIRAIQTTIDNFRSPFGLSGDLSRVYIEELMLVENWYIV